MMNMKSSLILLKNFPIFILPVAISSDTESVPAILVDRLLKGDNPLKAWREHPISLSKKSLKPQVSLVPFLCQLETEGKRQPSLKTYQKLAKILKVSIDDLIEGERQ